MSKRTVDDLVRRVREELRAEGADGAGYSDFIIIDAMNNAVDDLSGLFSVRDYVEFHTEEGVNTYDLSEIEDFDGEIYNIIKVEYDGKPIKSVHIDHFSNMDTESGEVRGYLLWGTKITLIGEVRLPKYTEEEIEQYTLAEGPPGYKLSLWITRSPKLMPYDKKDQSPELPRYVDEAIVVYALNVCYRESNDFDRANFYYGLYSNKKSEVMKRAIPQVDRDSRTQTRDEYAPPMRGVHSFRRTDYNPGGRWEDK